MPTSLSLLCSYAAAMAFGYLCGSIPFGLLLTRLAGTEDIRHIGSGNIGATNVLRTGRKGLAAATLIGDALKGTVAVLLVQHFSDRDSALFAALGAFLGHLFPIWLKFRGGKGVATYIGILFGIAWPLALGFCLLWLVVAAVTRYSSLAALVASTVTPVVPWLLDDPRAALLLMVLTALLWVMHRANIARLMAGTEGRIGQRSSTQS